MSNVPYDFKVLATRLQKSGLTVTEDAAKAAFKDVFSWVKESADASATPFDNVIVSVVEQFVPVVLGELDKIDGEVG